MLETAGLVAGAAIASGAVAGVSRHRKKNDSGTEPSEGEEEGAEEGQNSGEDPDES
ncbi:MAG: hypothetical protein QCH35_11280 [Methanomicrobiaceae archaeon]|nr:hypothetical protein [Methanomicrobiaceae archaeon]